MQKEELQQQAIALIEQLSTEELKLVVDLLLNLQNKQEQDTAHPVDIDAEIALEEILKNYDRAWKALAKH